MRKLIRVATISIVFAIGMNDATCQAEIADQTPQELIHEASHVFTGKVARIYSMTDRSSPKWDTIHSIAEIQVSSVEKGRYDHRLVYVRFWRKRYKVDGPSPPGEYGHRGVPKAGATTKVFVATADDGGYDVLSPNGFAAVAERKPLE